MANHSEIRRLNKLLIAIREKVSDAMSVQQLQVLLAVAADPGIGQSDIREKCNLSRSATSKNAADLTKLTSKKVAGPDLVIQSMDPMNLVVRTYRLSTKGEKVIEELFPSK